MAFDNRDDIDFAKEPVGRLFRKMFLPTLVAMVSMVVLNITDNKVTKPLNNNPQVELAKLESVYM